DSYSFCPSRVSRNCFWLRSTISTLKCFSIARSCWLTADCVMQLSLAALEKLWQSTRSENTFKFSICMRPPNIKWSNPISILFLEFLILFMEYHNFCSNCDTIMQRLATACKAAGRSAEAVQVLPVTKFHPAQAVLHAARYGFAAVGENRVAELVQKKDECTAQLAA